MIRQGAPADLPAITAVRTAVRENHLSVEQMAALGITHQSIAARMAAGDLGCWVAEDGGALVGFSMADRLEEEIFALFVHPAHEGRGFGSALLDVAEAWLRQQGCETASLSTARGTRAYAFYGRKGWRATGQSSVRFEEDAIMEKRLR